MSLVLFVVMLGLVGAAYYLTTQDKKATSNIVQNTPKTSEESSKPSCSQEKGCWFEASEGKMGYGELKGYYISIKKSNAICDSFAPSSHDSIFYDLDGRDYASDNTPVLSINLKNLSDEIQQKIKQSTKSNPITLKVVQIPTGGYGYKGCMPSSASILDVIN